MLRNSRLRIAEIGQLVRLTPDEVRRGLDELARMSLVRSSCEDPEALRAVPPQVGLAALLASQEQELRLRQEKVSATKAALDQMVDDYLDASRSRPYDGVEQLIGLDAIRGRIESLASACEREMVGLAPGGAQTQENLEASKPVDLAILNRGVRMRTVYLDSLAQDAPSLSYAHWLTDHGAEVRTVATLPVRMIIYDRRSAVLPMDPDDSAAGAVVLHGTGVVTALSALFDQLWTLARDVGEGREPTDENLSGQEQAVLHLLAQGCTDEVVARKLGVSVRTGRRITAGLLTRLDARSRFQAGVRSVASGWLSPQG